MLTHVSHNYWWSLTWTLLFTQLTLPNNCIGTAIFVYLGTLMIKGRYVQMLIVVGTLLTLWSVNDKFSGNLQKPALASSWMLSDNQSLTLKIRVGSKIQQSAVFLSRFIQLSMIIRKCPNVLWEYQWVYILFYVKHIKQSHSSKQKRNIPS